MLAHRRHSIFSLRASWQVAAEKVARPVFANLWIPLVSSELSTRRQFGGTGRGSNSKELEVSRQLPRLAPKSSKDQEVQEQVKALHQSALALSAQLEMITKTIKQLETDISPEASVYAAKVFINGDAMPKAALDWVKNVVAEKGRMQIFKAVGASSQLREDALLKQFCQIPGIQEEDVHISIAKTNCKNAADANLSVLYGMYAGPMNYILSDDKQWFGELPTIDPEKKAVWLKFSELDDLGKTMPKLFVEYMQAERKKVFKYMKKRPFDVENATAALEQMYHGKRFRQYVEEAKQAEWVEGEHKHAIAAVTRKFVV